MAARDAPSAARIDNSRPRPVARASMRFATLAQAMSNTKPTAAISTSSMGSIPRAASRTSGWMFVRQSLFVAGYCPARPAFKRVSSARACSSGTSGASRPVT